jgi:hypothetical protein
VSERNGGGSRYRLVDTGGRLARQRERQAQELAQELRQARSRLVELLDAVSSVEQRTRGWDLADGFQARRARALRQRARQAFDSELERVHLTLASGVADVEPGLAVGVGWNLASE